ncbi:MAG: helix-turn-helix transcriptional regulator [Hoeflea sp.]|uniref:helix-turn-helix transcriptional regulator n=1 Tax=Hoeflea sp. TaxID=1940281 RepID=UPI00329A5451
MELSNDKISALIDCIYESTMHENQWVAFVEALCELYPGIAVSMIGQDAGQKDQVFVSSGLSKEWLERYAEEFACGNELTRVQSRLPVGQVFCQSELLPNGSFHETEFFRSWFQPQGLDAVTGFVIAQGGGRSLVLNLYYSTAKKNGQIGSLRSLLKLLAPHLSRATEQFRRLHVTRTIASEFSGLMDALVIPSIVTDDKGKFLIANSAGDGLLDDPESLRMDSKGYIALPNDDDTALLREKISSAAKNQLPSGFRCHTEEGFQSIRIIPFRSSTTRNSDLQSLLYGPQPRVAIFIGQKDTFIIDDSILLDVFQLTPREAEICRRLMAMQTPTEIASSQDKSLRTVRNQIQAIYAKLGITRNAELSDALAVFKIIGKIQ